MHIIAAQVLARAIDLEGWRSYYDLSAIKRQLVYGYLKAFACKEQIACRILIACVCPFYSAIEKPLGKDINKKTEDFMQQTAPFVLRNTV